MARRRSYRGFRTDGAHALRASPRYFLAWYTLKSLLLVAVTAALAYKIGKSAQVEAEPPKPMPVRLP